MTLSTAERFLEERKGEPSSVVGSDIGSEVGDEKIAKGDGVTEEEIKKGNSFHESMSGRQH